MAEAPEAADPAEIEEHGIVALLENVPDSKKKKSSYAVKMGLAQMLRGGVIMDVDNVEQARIAEESGAAAVMVLGQKKTGHVERMSDPDLVKEIKKAVSIPVMAKVRIGHFVEAQILEALDVDFVDESEVLSIADDENFINKHNFRMPFVCGYCDLGEALRRIAEGAAMMRTKGGSDGGDIMEAVKQARSLIGEVRHLQAIHEDELFAFSKSICAPYELVKLTKQLGRIPVVNFAAGGITTPADAAMLMQVGCDGIFIGSEIFRLPDPSEKVRSIVRAVLNYNDSQILAEVSGGINEINLDGRNAE